VTGRLAGGRVVQGLALVVVVAIVLSVPGWAGDYWTRILTGVCMWAGLALAWNVIGGYAGYISFGHAAFFGIGAYATALLMQPERHWNFFLTLPVGAAAAAVVAAVVGWPTLKLRGAYFAIATWALAEAIAQLATVVSFTGGSSGLTIPAFASSSYFTTGGPPGRRR
jgi:branched-chain amino acid transport system permease protein